MPYRCCHLGQKTESTPRDLNHAASLSMQAIRDSFLVQHVLKPMHYRGDQATNVLDLVFTNEQEMIENIRHETLWTRVIKL